MGTKGKRGRKPREPVRGNEMSEAKKIEECYRRLIAAIVQQAIRDKAVWFLESPDVKSYCASVGITIQIEETIRPVGARHISHNAGGNLAEGESK
jgi:hypothetical protein